MKKFICTVCGYVHEGDSAPATCPQCKQPAEKFKELVESDKLQFVTEHELGVAKGTGEEMIRDLNAHFMGEATEVGMYLAMSRQADREGYPEIAEAFKRYAWEEAEHAAKFAELLGDVGVRKPACDRLKNFPLLFGQGRYRRILQKKGLDTGRNVSLAAGDCPDCRKKFGVCGAFHDGPGSA